MQQSRGAKCVSGKWMLVHQAVAQLAAWAGDEWERRNPIARHPRDGRRLRCSRDLKDAAELYAV